MVKIMENPVKMDDLGVPLFLETPNMDWLCVTLKQNATIFELGHFIFWYVWVDMTDTFLALFRFQQYFMKWIEYGLNLNCLDIL